MSTKWIEWAMRMQAIAQAGRAYSENPYDIERYKQLQELASEMMAAHSDHEHEHVRDILEGETGYATPKLDIRGVVFDGDKVLLVQETIDGRWSLPGGWADVYSSPSENVVREIREESGYEAVAKRLLAIYDKSRHGYESISMLYVYKLFFLCELTGGEPATSIETSDVGFFGLEELPPLSTTRITEEQIRRMYELREEEATDFD